MVQHRYKVGQIVGYSPEPQSSDAASRQYKILRLLPVRGSEPCYQIKRIAEAYERVAKESELVLHHAIPAPVRLAYASRDIHVARAPEAGWVVKRAAEPNELATYRLKAYAMAFARALAFSDGVEMVVHDPNGAVTRYRRAALTYPSTLD